MENLEKVVELIGGSEFSEDPISKYEKVHKYSVFPKVYEANKGSSKDQKICNVCRTGIGGIVEKKKLECQFCYNAVCQNCSPLKCNHPDTLKEERVCMQCYIFAIEDQVRNEVKEQVSSEFGADDQNQRIKETLKTEIKDHEEELKNLDFILQGHYEELDRLKVQSAKRLEEKNQKIKQEKINNEKELKDLNEKILKAKEETKEKRARIEKQNKKIDELKRFIQMQENKLAKLKSDAEAERNALEEVRGGVDSDKDLQEKEKLLEELNKLKVEIAELQKQQEVLKAQRSYN
jgi:DNA repair exonuclease SbcCD ATPase subunit